MDCTPSSSFYRRSVCLSLISTLFCNLFVPTASARNTSSAQDAFPLVARAIRAKHNQHFIAREDIVLFQTTQGPKVTVGNEIRIVADVVRDGAHVRLSYLLPPATAHRVIVDDGCTFEQWEPSQRLILADKSHEQPPTAEWQMLQMLHDNYQCRLQRHVRLNGLDCDLILIHRRCPGGGDRRLWIERSHHVILRTEEYDTAGHCRYLSCYETFHFAAHILPSLFRIAAVVPVRRMPHLMSDRPSAQAAFTSAGLHGCLPAWLPQGYAMIGCALATYHGGGHAAVLRYGDGLQTFCVFEENCALPGGSSRSTLPPHRRLVQTGQQVWEVLEPETHIVIIGDAVLPDSLGMEMLQALDPHSKRLLRTRFVGDFGPRLCSAAIFLRKQGWSYDQIVSLALYLQTHPEKTDAAAIGWEHGERCRQMMSSLHAPWKSLDRAARRWIAAALKTSRTP